jgi:serine/threonine protein kinase/Flp pilus assembly protein TadD
MKTPDERDGPAKVLDSPITDDSLSLPGRLAALAGQPSEFPSTTATAHAEVVERAYEDFCDLVDAGEALDPEEYCERFPECKSALARLIDAHGFLEANPELLAGKRPIAWPEPGQRFLGFEIRQELGRGGIARVFLAREPALGNRTVAVKVSEQGAAEAQTLGRLSHPNIVPAYSVHVDEATALTAVCMPYLGSATLSTVLEFLHGEAPPRQAAPLRKVVTDRFAPDAIPTGGPAFEGSYVDAVCKLGAQLADALQFIHDRKVLHRDLKPSNVLVTPDGRPMLLDFNLCADPEAADSRLGGTLPYMPPEQLLALRQDQTAEKAESLDARSDIYSLGVILYELFTGRHPFGKLPRQMSIEEARRQFLPLQQEGPTPLRSLNPEVDAKLARLIERCLSYNPKNRPTRAAELASAFRRQLSLVGRARRWIIRHPFVTAAATLTLATLVAAGAVLWPEREDDAVRHWRLGQLAYRQKNYADAIEHFNQLDTLQPGRADVMVARGRAYQQLADTDPAKYRSFYGQAVHNYFAANQVENRGSNLAASAYCALRQRDHVTAGPQLEEALKSGFTSAGLYNNLGFFYFEQSKFPEALQYFNKALALDDHLQAAYHNRALVYFQQTLRASCLVDPLTKPRMDPQKAQADHDRFLELLTLAKKDVVKALDLEQHSKELLDLAYKVCAVRAIYVPDDVEEALKYFETAMGAGVTPPPPNDPILKTLHGHERFKALVADAEKRQQKAAAPTPATPALVSVQLGKRIVDPVSD